MTRRYRHIQRQDGRFRGWHVQLTRRGEVHSAFFPDRRWGGRRRALLAALSYRDEQLLALHPPVRIRRFFPRNTTGVVGVSLERRKSGAPRYCAIWPLAEGGPHQRRHFSVKKYGKRRAFALASAARREGVEDLESRVRLAVAEEVARRHRRQG